MREKYSVHLALATGCLIFLVTTLFALLQSPELLATAGQGEVAMPHPLVAHQKCDNCHGHAGIRPYPIRHLGWSNTSCPKCHLPPAIAASSPAALDSKDEAATRAERQAGRSALSGPEDNGLRPEKKAGPIPHPLTGREECLTCHDTRKGFMPAPPDHAGWQKESCEGCHSRSGEAEK
ncbi:MAG: hypothetical protein K0A99_04155 [Desulfoarculaceae bacterium]|nr:hypothetical protein [Desulfoarculaceae bacterium]